MTAPGKIRWSILVATQPSRAEFLDRLLGVLGPQIKQHEDVELIVRVSNPEIGLGDNRQILREQARGMYSNFVDDDDLVAKHYVARILPCLDEVDYVTHQFQEYADGIPRPLTRVRLDYGRWWQDKAGLYRDIVHFCPIKTALALLAPMEGGWGEDTRWSNQMRRLGVIKTERHLEDVLCFLYFRSKKTDGAKHVGPYLPNVTMQPMPVSSTHASSGSSRTTYDKDACPSCGTRGMLVPSNGQMHCNQCGREVGESMRAPGAASGFQKGAGR